jgi:stage V sporulation protein B
MMNSPNEAYIKRNSLNNLLSNTYWALFSTIFLVATGFVVNIIVGNELGEELYGVYSLAVTIYLLVGMVFFMGIPFSLAKYSAEYIDRVEINRQYYTASFISVVVATSVGGILLFSLRYVIADLFKTPEFIRIIPLIAVGMPFLGIYRTGISRLNGLREMRRMALGDTLRYMLFLILTIIFVALLDTGLLGAVLSLILSDVLVCFYIVWSTKLVREWDISKFKERFLRLGWFGSQVVLARIVEELDARSSLLLVGYFLSNSDVGLYSLASMIAMAISIVPQALQKVTGPAMTEMYACNRIESINSMMNQVMKLSAIILTFAACFLVLFFDNIILLLYSKQPGFLEAAGIFNILAFGAIFYGTTVSISPIFFSMERPDITLKIAIIRVVVTVLVTIIAIKPLGVIGAAIGGAGTGLLVFGFWIYYMHKLLGVKLEWRSLVTIPVLGASIVMLTKAVNIIIVLPWHTYIINIVGLIIFVLLVVKIWHVENFYKLIRRSVNSFSGS